MNASIETSHPRYEPDSSALLRQIPDVADGLSARLHKLVETRDPALADQIIRDSSGLTALVLRIATALRRETERGHEQP